MPSLLRLELMSALALVRAAVFLENPLSSILNICIALWKLCSWCTWVRRAKWDALILGAVARTREHSKFARRHVQSSKQWRWMKSWIKDFPGRLFRNSRLQRRSAERRERKSSTRSLMPSSGRGVLFSVKYKYVLTRSFFFLCLIKKAAAQAVLWSIMDQSRDTTTQIRTHCRDEQPREHCIVLTQQHQLQVKEYWDLGDRFDSYLWLKSGKVPG